MSEEQHVYTFEGEQYQVSEAQAIVLHKLDKARVSILKGVTESVALVESAAGEDSWRGWYVSTTDEAKTRLMQRVATLQRKIRRDLFAERGNAPAANSSNMVH